MKIAVEQLIHIYTNIAWHGMNLKQAKEDILSKTLKEVNAKKHSNNSISIAKEAVEKYLLDNHQLIDKYLTKDNVTDKEVDKYFHDIKKYVLLTKTKEEIYNAVIEILDDIHDRWILDNAHEYNLDQTRQDKRLFQHLPLYLIGIKETCKDLIFVAPLLEAIGIKVGYMQSTPYGEFIANKQLIKAYNNKSKEFINEYKLNELNNPNRMIYLINHYPPLLSMTNNGIKRREYMSNKAEFLIDQMCEKLNINKYN